MGLVREGGHVVAVSTRAVEDRVCRPGGSLTNGFDVVGQGGAQVDGFTDIAPCWSRPDGRRPSGGLGVAVARVREYQQGPLGGRT
jgi:hypothetical protein